MIQRMTMQMFCAKCLKGVGTERYERGVYWHMYGSAQLDGYYS